MKFGRVLTYKDIEEAKKLIGKKFLFSGELYAITENPNGLAEDFPEDIGVLSNIFTDFEMFNPFKRDDVKAYQFIREVIEDEPKYRPFKDVNELIEYWEKNYCTTPRPTGAMPLIWVKTNDADGKLLITEFWNDGVLLSIYGDTVKMDKLFNKFVFLDGHPCGAEVEE